MPYTANADNNSSPTTDIGDTPTATECELLRAECARATAEVLRVTAEATRVVAEAARLQSEVSRLGSECEALRAENASLKADISRTTAGGTMSSTACEQLRAENARLVAEVARVTVETTRVTAETIRMKDTARLEGPTGLLINERVGSVSYERLAKMTAEEKSALDCALTRIVARACISGLSWQQIAPIIRDELAVVGLQFATAESFYDDANGDWARARNVGFSDLRRVGFAVDSSRVVSGAHWYPDEMFRVLKQLMEFRGFRA